MQRLRYGANFDLVEGFGSESRLVMRKMMGEVIKEVTRKVIKAHEGTGVEAYSVRKEKLQLPYLDHVAYGGETSWRGATDTTLFSLCHEEHT